VGFSSYDDFIAERTAGKGDSFRLQKTSLATVGVASTWYTAWPWTGWPGAGAYTGTALNAQQCVETTTGAIWHGGNTSPDTKHLLWLGAMAAAATAVPGSIIIYDRLLYYPGISALSTANQALVNGVSLPRYTTGEGVRAWLEVTTALTTGIGTMTFGTSGYTNQAGTTARQHGGAVNTAASSAIARIPHSGVGAGQWNPFLPLQAGDYGIRSAQSIQFTTAHAAGAVALVLGKPLGTIPLPAVNVWSERDFMFQIANLPQIIDGACLSFLVYEPGALVASTSYQFELGVGWG
jgi:hypothetical protein